MKIKTCHKALKQNRKEKKAYEVGEKLYPLQLSSRASNNRNGGLQDFQKMFDPFVQAYILRL